MTRLLLSFGRYTFLVAVTLLATLVMWWVSRPNTEGVALAQDSDIAPAPVAAQPKSRVFATTIEPAWCDVTVRYSGKIRPWENYTLGFEIGGRVAELGQNEEGGELDDGDRVSAGQVIARLDDRILRARQSEAVAQYELAASDLARSRRVRELSPGALAESDFQNDLTQVALTKAMQEIAIKNLEDAVLRSPVNGAIVRRMVEVGESVNPHAHIFEIVENDKLRLVVNVPEARVRELELRRRAVAASRRNGTNEEFTAMVRLEGSDIYGKPWPEIRAEVHHIAEVADQVTGLFEIEILIPNDDGLLRPGMVATAEIVTDKILAYEVPESSILFRQGQTYLFTLDEEPADMKVMFWDVDQTTVHRARRVELNDLVDQGDKILLPSHVNEVASVVTRGQQRLRDGQLVRVVGGLDPRPTEPASVAERNDPVN